MSYQKARIETTENGRIVRDIIKETDSNGIQKMRYDSPQSLCRERRKDDILGRERR